MHDCRMLPPRIVYNSRQYLGKDRRHHAAARQRAFSTSIINNPDKHCRRFDRRRTALAARAGGLSAASSPHGRRQIEPRISLRSSGSVSSSEYGTTPDQLCTAPLCYALHRIRETRRINADSRIRRAAASRNARCAPPSARTAAHRRGPGPNR